jgi:hypothetical protein
LADPVFGINAQAADTGGGTQAYTKSGIGTPNAVYMIDMRGAVTPTTVDDGAMISTGMATGATERAGVTRSDAHGSANMDCSKMNSTTAILARSTYGSTTVRGTLDFSSFGSDTFTGTWDTTPSTAGYSIASMIVATSASVDTITPTSSGVSISPGFDIDVAIVISACGSSSSGSSANSHGFVTNTDGLKQCCHMVASDDGAATGEPSGRVGSAVCGGQVGSDGVLDYTVTASFPASNQITLTTSTATPGDQYHVLCLNIGDGQAWTGVVDTPTTTAGTHTFSEPGFQPSWNYMIATGITAVDAQRQNSPEAGSYAHCVSTSADQYSAAYADEDGSATSDTQSVITGTPLHKPADDGTADLAATYVSMAATGMEVNFSNVNGSALKCPMLTIGAAEAGTSIPLFMHHYRQMRVG